MAKESRTCSPLRVYCASRLLRTSRWRSGDPPHLFQQARVKLCRLKVSLAGTTFKTLVGHMTKSLPAWRKQDLVEFAYKSVAGVRRGPTARAQWLPACSRVNIPPSCCRRFLRYTPRLQCEQPVISWHSGLVNLQPSRMAISSSSSSERLIMVYDVLWHWSKTIWIFSRPYGNFPGRLKLSWSSGNFPDHPETFQVIRILSKPSKNFPDILKNFQVIRRLFCPSINCPIHLETFLAIWKLSRTSENFLGHPKAF